MQYYKILQFGTFCLIELGFAKQTLNATYCIY